MAEAQTKELTIRPLEVRTDNRNRLQIPSLVVKMLKARPGQKYNLFVDEDEGMYFSKVK